MLNLATTTPARSTGASHTLPEYDTLNQQAAFYHARAQAATTTADFDAAFANYRAFEILALDVLAAELRA